jgi:two-component system chemotaxis response regulator CheY
LVKHTQAGHVHIRNIQEVRLIKKILLVDDSRASRFIIKGCLPKDRGYELSEAADGKAGLEMYKEFKPDLTFLDLTMPVMDGYEALEEIMKYDSNALVIVLTADIQKKAREKVAKLGSFKVIPKPPTREAMGQAILEAEEMLNRKNEATTNGADNACKHVSELLHFYAVSDQQSAFSQGRKIYK